MTRRIRLVWVQIGLAVVAVTLGTVGYASGGGGHSWWKSIYRAVALFFADTAELDGEPTLAAIARWIALAVSLSAIVSLTAAVLRGSVLLGVRRFRARDHFVVVGLGHDGVRHIEALVGERRPVVGVAAADDEAAARVRDMGVPVVIGPPSSKAALERARVQRARAVLVTLPDDALSAHSALVAHGIAPGCRVLALLNDPAVHSALVDRLIRRDGGLDAVELVFLPTVAARRAVAALSPFALGRPGVAVVVGNGPVAASVAIEVAARAPDGTRVHILTGDDPTTLVQNDDPRFAAVDLAPERLELGTIKRLAERLTAEHTPSHWYFCDQADLGRALAVTDALTDAIALVLVRAETPDVAQALRAALDDVGEERVRVLDVTAESLGVGLLSEGMVDDIARAKHAQYLRDEVQKGRTLGGDDVMVAWDELGADLQQSNRDFAQGIAALIERKGLRLRSVPPEGAQRIRIFDAAEIDGLAQVEHDRWMRDRESAGWSHGDVRDNARKLHPDMVPWEDLPEASREKDREPIRDLGRILAAAGLQAVAAGPDSHKRD